MPVFGKIARVFSEEHAASLTGLSKGQLRAWDRKGFFVPRYAYDQRRDPYSRIYSFQDVVGLRTIAVLMKDHHVSLQELRRVAEEFLRRGYGHWAKFKLYVVKRQVHFRRPGSKDIEGLWDGQLAMVTIVDAINGIEKRARDISKRSEDQIGRIEQHRHVVRNAPVVAGTRIPTAAIRRFHQAGYSVKEIIREYPTLTANDVSAALSYEEGLAQSA